MSEKSVDILVGGSSVEARTSFLVLPSWIPIETMSTTTENKPVEETTNGDIQMLPAGLEGVADGTEEQAVPTEGKGVELLMTAVAGAAPELQNVIAEDEQTVACINCSRIVKKSDCVYVGGGRSKKPKCNGCNRVQGKITTINKVDDVLAGEWRNLSDKEKQDFVSASHELDADALKTKMKAEVVLKKAAISSVSVSQGGIFMPMSYWRAKGFTAQECAAIEKNCENYVHQQLGVKVYKVNLFTESKTDTDRTENSTTWSRLPAPAQVMPTSVGQPGTPWTPGWSPGPSSSHGETTPRPSDVMSDSGSSKRSKNMSPNKIAQSLFKKAQAQKKKDDAKKLKEERIAQNKAVKEAKGWVSKLAPVLVSYKDLMADGLSTVSADRCPSYLREEGLKMWSVLQQLDMTFQKSMKGSPLPSDESCQGPNVQSTIKKAEKIAENLAIVMSMGKQEESVASNS